LKGRDQAVLFLEARLASQYIQESRGKNQLSLIAAVETSTTFPGGCSGSDDPSSISPASTFVTSLCALQTSTVVRHVWVPARRVIWPLSWDWLRPIVGEPVCRLPIKGSSVTFMYTSLHLHPIVWHIGTGKCDRDPARSRSTVLLCRIGASEAQRVPARILTIK